MKVIAKVCRRGLERASRTALVVRESSPGNLTSVREKDLSLYRRLIALENESYHTEPVSVIMCFLPAFQESKNG